MTSWHRYSEPLAGVVILLVCIPPIKHRKGKNLEPDSAEGVGEGGRTMVCLPDGDRGLGSMFVARDARTAFVPGTAYCGGEPWFMGKRVVRQCFASILTRLQLDSLQSDAVIASLTCHGSGGSIPGFGSLELPLDGRKVWDSPSQSCGGRHEILSGADPACTEK